MRFMVLVKANPDSEAGVMPSEKVLTEMTRFNEELVKAGIMLAAEGLQASSKGARVRFSGGKRTVIDGPFSETKELIAIAGLARIVRDVGVAEDLAQDALVARAPRKRPTGSASRRSTTPSPWSRLPQSSS